MKRFLRLLILVLLLALIAIFFYLNKNSFIVTSYVAKKACGCHLLADRTIASIYEQDVNRFPLNLVKIKIDENKQRATASLLGLWSSTVQKTKGRGCVLLTKTNEPLVDFEVNKVSASWEEIPNSDLLNKEDLDMAFDLAFDQAGEYVKKTRALLVYYKDSLVREQYAEGFDKDTRILGWSMNKSIIHALIGILIENNKLKLTDNNLFEEWKDDERADITIDDLLKMSGGFDWDEDYTQRSDATNLLFGSYDCADFALNQPLEATPGSYWEYSSGTSNILSKLIRNQFETTEAYLKFPYDSLFNRIGMSSIIVDTDQAGTYIFSSYGYATPRDWAKFGLLYLNNGMHGDEQIISEEWVKYASIPAEKSSNKLYGSHFWLNAGGAYPDVPKDMFSCNGFQGQFTYIIPSKDMVVVRMGLSEGDEYDKNGVLKHLVNAVKY